MRWVDTPWVHAQGVCGVGVDCAYMVLRMAERFGYMLPFSVPPYPRQWNLHKNDETLLDVLHSTCREIDKNSWLPGDILTFRYGRVQVAHISIAINEAQMVHAAIDAGKVLVSHIPLYRHTKTFLFPGVDV